MAPELRDEALLKELLIEWEEQLERGEDVAAGILVGDRQDLVPALQQRIDALKRFSGWFGVVDETVVSSPDEKDAWPLTIGRYRVRGLLGKGGFGVVYLAQDDDLVRLVAIKVPHPARVAGPGDAEAYLREAQALAKLDHTNIVPVYDVGRTDDGLCYVVSKYISGIDLSIKIKQDRPGFQESAELAAVVAEALHHAHIRGLVHRDVKPANILIDAAGEPCVADFGLALRDEDYGNGARCAGTPDYMSPEQARGEGHRVDRRSDIFSLGVVLYELLTGRLPFRGESVIEVLKQIAAVEPTPPREIDDTIPHEAARITSKALAKRSTERYSTAWEMAEDLRNFLRVEAQTLPSFAITSPTDPATKVVPKGLRSFDQQDADFFLELLPGPRDRDGLPESLRFWKSRIEATNPEITFRVGLIYGPSGCGKSSLAKAGLLPRLEKHVLPVYIEATPRETKARLLRGLHKVHPELPVANSLIETMATLRQGRVLPPHLKVLLVLDQFEQSLIAPHSEEYLELVAALRQCDGEHVQAVVMVRDDFWIAATRFMRDVEVDFESDRNLAIVDLFDERHARKVLAAFGLAYGRRPEETGDLSKDRETFLDRAISGLSQDGHVIPVRLALFAEMVKGKPWTPKTLRDVGGIAGVGVTFLEETFASPRANPKYRDRQKSAQAVLKALLPQIGTDIKGQLRSASELRDASGYVGRPRDFEDLMRILDSELRLITPTDPERSKDEGQGDGEGSQRYYQLTHDYLVHSLRDWLTRKQRETRRGRAELRLSERAELWNAKPENRHLPSVMEWMTIRLLSKRRDWTEPQRRMMRRAVRIHGLRAIVLTAAVIALAIVSLAVRNRVVENNRATIAGGLVQQLLKADTSQVPAIVRAMQGYHHLVAPELRRTISAPSIAPKVMLHSSLALLPIDATQVPYLESRLTGASPSELIVLRKALQPYHSSLVPHLWSVLDAAQPGDIRVLPSAAALALYAPEDPRWAGLVGKLAEELVMVNPVFLGPWLDVLRDVKAQLTTPLASIFRENRPADEHVQTTSILAIWTRGDPALLADLLMDADPKAYATFFPLVEEQASKSLPLFQAELDKKIYSWMDKLGPLVRIQEDAKDRLAQRQARAATAMIRLGHAEKAWPYLRYGPDPQLRSYLINWLGPLGADPRELATELDHIGATERLVPFRDHQNIDNILFHPQTSTRRALILALGQYAQEILSVQERESLIHKLLVLYKNDPDAGIHGAAESTLSRWGQRRKLQAIDGELSGKKEGDRHWFVNSQAQTYVLLNGPLDFQMGSPKNDPDQDPDEFIHHRQIRRDFAIGTKEVTVEQYQDFAKDYPAFRVDEGYRKKNSPNLDGPMIGVSWHDAIAYCNWLSKKENLKPCYPDAITSDMELDVKMLLDNPGYRLPLEAEWEYSCRAGTITSRFFGGSPALLENYAWHLPNAGYQARPCGSLLPNDLGLFDMLGNVHEWCHERYYDYRNKYIYDENLYMRLTGYSEIIRVRVLRGGSFSNPPSDIRSAIRVRLAPSNRLFSYGFRLARNLPPTSSSPNESTNRNPTARD